MAHIFETDVTITGGSITAITDLAVADGGTGASTAAAARTNLEALKKATSSIDNAAAVFSGVTGGLTRSSPTVVYYPVASGAEDKVEFGATFKDYRTATDGPTVTLDFDLSDQWQVTFAGNRTLAFSNASVGQTVRILRYQDATGSRTPTWWSNISWHNGLAPVDDPTPSGWSHTELVCVRLDAYGVAVWTEVDSSTSAPRQGITTVTCAATTTFDLRKSSRQKTVLDRNPTLELQAGSFSTDQVVTLQIVQDATGGRAVTFGTSFGTITWTATGGVAPVLPTAANASCWLELVCTNTTGPTFACTGAAGVNLFSLSTQGESAGTGYTATRYSANASAPNFALRKARGTIAAPADAVAGDTACNFLAQAYDAGDFRTVANMAARCATGFGGGDSPGVWAVQTTPVGSYTQRDVVLFDEAGNLQFVVAGTLNAAAVDVVSLVGVDRINTRFAAAGNRVLAFQSERGSPIYLGADALDFAATTGVLSVNGSDLLSMTSTVATLAGTLTLSAATPLVSFRPTVNSQDCGLRILNAAGSVAGYLSLTPNTIGTNSKFLMYVGGPAAGDIKLTVDDDGKAVFIGNVAVEGSSQRRLALAPSNFGYSANFRTLTLGSTSTVYNTQDTGAVTLAFGVDPSANAGGSFTGDGSELLFRNVATFMTPNSGNTDYLKVMSFNNGNVGIGANTFSDRLVVECAADGGVVFSGRSPGGAAGTNNRFNLLAFSDGGGSGYGGGLKIQTRNSTNVFNDCITVLSTGNVIVNTSLTLGVAGTTTGSLVLCGSGGANTHTIKAAAIPAATNSYVWPSASPTASQVLTASAPATGVVTLSWASGGAGDVVGPASSTANAASVFSGTTGKLLRASPTVTYYSVSAGAEDKIEFGATFKDFRTATDGATVTLDLDLSDQWQVTFAGNRTLAVSNASIGQRITILRYQDATGNRTPTWWSNITWNNGLAPVDDPTASGWSLTELSCEGLDAYSVPKWKEISRSTSAPSLGITTATDGATVTFDLRVCPTQRVTLAGNRTLALTSGSFYVGQMFDIKLTQDATGSRTVTWFSAVKWTGGTIPTLTTTAGRSDWFRFICTNASGSPTFDCLGTSMNLLP